MLPVLLRRIPIERVEDTRVVIRVVPVQARNRMEEKAWQRHVSQAAALHAHPAEHPAEQVKRPRRHLRGVAAVKLITPLVDAVGTIRVDRIDPDRNFAAGLEKRRQRLERALAVGVCLGPRD